MSQEPNVHTQKHRDANARGSRTKKLVMLCFIASPRDLENFNLLLKTVNACESAKCNWVRFKKKKLVLMGDKSQS